MISFIQTILDITRMHIKNVYSCLLFMYLIIEFNRYILQVLKTGSCGLICYRLMTSNKTWQWLQSSMRVIYKSNKPECIIANHRPLT